MTGPLATRRAVLAAFATVPVAGCSLVDDLLPNNSLDSIALTIAPKVNDDTPLAVDFVYVADAQLVTALTALTAVQWWQQRADLALANPTTLTVESYEVSPGQVPPVVTLPDSSGDAVAIFVFAVYQTPGAHRARLENYSDAVVALGTKSFTVSGST